MYSFFIALLDGWYRFGSKSLKLFSEKKTWEQARQFCQSLGGDLVSINSKEENDFIHLLVEKTVERQGRYNPGGDSYMKRSWMLVETFQLNHKTEENTLGVARQ